MVFTSDKEMEENYDIISDHLFERLERILDTGGSSISNTSIQRNVTVKLQGEKDRSETGKKRKFSSWRRNEIDIG